MIRSSVLHLLAWRFALCCLLPLRCRLTQATTLLCLLSLVATLVLLRAPAGSPPPPNLPGMPLGIAVDTGTHVVVLTTVADDTVLAMDGPNATLLGSVPFYGYGTALAVDPVSGYVYVGSTHSQLVVLASPVSTPVATIDLDQPPVALAANPAAGRVYVATRDTRRHTAQDTLVVLDGLHYTVLAELPLGDGVLRLAVDATTNRVYVTDDGSDTLTVLDGASNARLATLPLGRGPHDLVVNARTGRVYVSNGTDHSLSVLDGSHGRVLDTVAVAGRPGAVGVNERTDRVYVVTDTGNVAVLDGRTDRLLATVAVGQQPAGPAIDAATDRVYVSDSMDGTVWLLQDGRFGHPSVRLLAFADQAGPSPAELHTS